jgi:hypothetical protein
MDVINSLRISRIAYALDEGMGQSMLNSYRVDRMGGPSDAASLVLALKRAKRIGAIDLDFSRTREIYPNGAVPVAVALDYFRRHQLRITARSMHERVRRVRVVDPLGASALNLREHPLKNLVWRYGDHRELDDLCKAFVGEIQDNADCGPGVIDALDWCISEVLDNVLQHSKSGTGFTMMQVHRQNPRCAIAIGDDRIGIRQSFMDGGVHGVEDEYEAIMKSIQERVTSKATNMGNGLYGLMRIVGLNGGELEIRSGKGFMSFRSNKISGDVSSGWPLLDDVNNRGTTVDWQLDLSRPVSIAEALGMRQPPPLIESLEDENDEHRVLVSDLEDGLSTRKSGEQIRTRLENYLRQGAPRLVLDFSGIRVVSSSFADEVLGKLALKMGLLSFVNKFSNGKYGPRCRSNHQSCAHAENRRGGQRNSRTANIPIERRPNIAQFYERLSSIGRDTHLPRISVRR